MLDPLPVHDLARFSEEFGQRVLLTVDTEEEFDWASPFRREGYTLEHVEQIARFQLFCEEIGAHPVYLVDWPITQSGRAVEIIGEAVARKKADIGIQLHAWVNPPFHEDLTQANSFAGNLPHSVELAKFTALREAIQSAFGIPPQIYRAGRYGAGADTPGMLGQAGVAIDSSARPLFDYSDEGGPDYTHHPASPYWLDPERTLLELPVTSVYWGLLRNVGRQVHRAQRHVPTFFGLMSRLSLLERIALTPEGVTIDEAMRGIDIALDEQIPLMVLSFHSPSLSPGHTPYVKTQEDVERLYDWFRAVYTYFGQRGVRSASIAEVLSAVKR